MKVYLYRAGCNEDLRDDVQVFQRFEYAQEQFQKDFAEHNGCEWFEIENEYHADIGDCEWFRSDDEDTREFMRGYQNITFRPNEDWEILYGDEGSLQGEPIGARVPYKNGDMWWLIEEAESL